MEHGQRMKHVKNNINCNSWEVSGKEIKKIKSNNESKKISFSDFIISMRYDVTLHINHKKKQV